MSALELGVQILCSSGWPVVPNVGEIPLILPQDEMSDNSCRCFPCLSSLKLPSRDRG